MKKANGRVGVVASLDILNKNQVRRLTMWCEYDVMLVSGSGVSFDSRGVLAEVSFSVGEYAKAVGVSKSTAYRDLKAFRQAGIIDVAVVSQWRKNSRKHWFGYTRDGWWVANYLFNKSTGA